MAPDPRIARSLEAYQRLGQRVAEEMAEQIEAAAALVGQVLGDGGKVLLLGNGGSAAMAQHLAAELVGRYQRERAALAAVALTTDSSILTAVANDYDFDQVFSRQVQALARKEDLLWALSTSGQSKNVLQALSTGRAMGCQTLALSGKGGGPMAALADCCLVLPSDDTARIQEAQLLVGHLICELVEAGLE